MIMSIGAVPGAALTTLRLSDQLAARLAAQIESGALKPGDRLPTELQLAESHGVSRTVVREAVHQLKSRSLLHSRQGSGVFVAEAPVHHALAFDAEAFGSSQLVAQVAEVRRALEGEIAALAAERASKKQVAAIRRSVVALAAANAAGGDGVDEDLAFHHALAEATGNPQFTRILAFLGQALHEAMRVTRAHDALRQEDLDAVHAEHLAIADAVAAADPALARKAALRHMARGEARLKRGGVIPDPTAPQRRIKRPSR